MSNVIARNLPYRILGLCLVQAVACSHAMLSHAENSILDDPAERAFTRIEATLDIIQSLTADSFYLPMEREQFENIVSSLRSNIPNSIRRRASIDRATYSARLVGDQLVDGQGSFLISSDTKVETEIALGDLDLSMQQPHWRSRNDEARLGIANTGERVLLVPSAGTCDFQWSRRGAANSAGTEFTFNLCDSLQHQFTITTPNSVDLVSNRGTCTLTSSDSERIWNLRLSGAGLVRLNAIREMAAVPSRLAFATQKIVYQASDTGMVVSSTIHLDEIARDTKTIMCELTPGLSPTNIMVDSTSVPWIAREVQHDGSLSIVIQLPHLESEGQDTSSESPRTNRIIRIAGTASIAPVGPQPLPRIRLPQCEWMQETAFMNVSEAAVVQSLRPTQCQQTEYSRNGTKSSYRFDYSAADGSIEIQLGRSNDEVNIETCTFVSLVNSVVSAKTETEVSVQRGNAFSLHANVKEGWSIEGVDVGSIEGQSANVIDRWEEVGSDNEGNHQLLIRFRRPIEPSRPLRLSITSTRGFASGITYNAEDFEPLAFQRSSADERYVIVENSGANRFAWQDGQNAAWLTASHIPRKFLGSRSIGDTDVLLRLQSIPSGVQFQLIESDARFNSEVEIQARVSKGVADELVRLQITPTGGIVRSVAVESIGISAYRWTEGNSNELVTVEQTSKDGNRVSLRLQSATDAPFELIGRRTVSFNEQYSLHSLCLPQSNSQSGSLYISAAFETQIDLLETDGIQQSPYEATDDTKVIGTHFRFTMLPQALATPIPLLSLQVADDLPGRRSFVWLYQPTTVVDPLCQHRHFVTLLVENHGDSSLPLIVPNNCIVTEIIVDGRSVTSASSKPGAFVIPLPSTNRFPVVQVEMTERQDSSVVAKRLGQRVTCPQIVLDVPIFDRQWKVWTPPGALPTRAEHWNSRLTSHNIMKRFFGSFARKPGTTPFDFFSDQSWLKLFRAKDRNSALSTAKLLSDRLAKDKRSKSTTWHDAILAFDDANRIAKSSSLIVPLIDAKRLAERGVTPATTLRTELANATSESREDPNYSAMRNALAEHNLAIIATRTHIYLTTAEAIGLLELPIEWTGIPNVVRVSDGVLSRDSIDEQIGDQLGRLETIPNWLTGSVTTRWELAPTDDMLLLIGGWRMTQVVSPSATSLLYVDRYFVSRLSVVCFLFVACVAWYMSRLGAHWSIGSILIAAATCVLLPNAVSQVGSMLFWGTTVGCLLHWSKRALGQYNDVRRSNAHFDERTVVVSKSVLATLLLLVLTLGASQLKADEPPDAPPTIERVYVPIDSDGTRDDQNKVYLSRSFYETLLEYEVRSNGLAAKWLLESSNYRASIDGDSDAETISVTAEYELRTLDADVTVQLPIPLDAMRVLQRDTKLNRRPFRLKNEANADSVDIFFADAGLYELELTFEVPIRSEGDYNSILLPVIPVLDSHIQLSSFLDVRSIKIQSHGKVEPDVQQGELRADLGAADAIDVSWRINRSVDRDMEATCSQIGWLHANDAEVSYSCKLLLDYPTGQVSPVSIVTESRLTPSISGDQPISIDKLDGYRNRFYFLPTLQSETEAIVHVQFDMVNTFGIGRIRLPRIEVENVKVTSHLLATSIDSSLVGIPWRTSGVTAVPLSEFSEIWQSPSPSPPDHIYVVNDPEYTCIFGFLSLNAEAQVSFETDYVLSESRTEINLTATINSGSNPLFQASFRIPNNVAISRVSTIQGSIRQPVEWARGDESTVTVFLPGESTGPTLIEVKGHVPNTDGRFEAPSFAPVDMLSKDDRITLYRKSGVQITSIEEQGYSIIPADGAESKSSTYDGAIVHSSRLQNSDSATLAVNVQSREPDFELKSMLTFQETEAGIEYDLQMRFMKGASDCDILRLHVPGEWSLPILENDDLSVRSMPSPHSQSQIFAIKPNGRIQSNQVIRLNGLAAQKTSQELSANISVTGGRLTESLIGIRDNQSNSYWEPNGMTVHDDNPPSYYKNTEDYVFYRATSTSNTFHQRRHVEDNSFASLQSIRHTIFAGDVRTQVVTDIVIVAQGSGAIVLNLPAHSSMQQASINGVPLQVRVDSNHRFPITIARSDALQSVRFIWYSTQTRSSRSIAQDFDFPQLVQESTSVSESDRILETNETIWQFKIPKSLEGVEFFVSDRRLESDDELVLRDYTLPSEPTDQHFAFRVGRYGKNTDTRVRYVQPNRTSVYTRVMAAVTAFCGGVFVVHSRFKPLTVPEAELWVYNGAVLFGIGWWLFLQPSLFGWIIVGGILLIAWLTRW